MWIAKVMGPGLMIALSLWTAIIYFVARDWKHGLYWIAASVLTATVTAMGD